MDDKRQHVAVIKPPEDFERFENEQSEEGVVLTKGFRGTEDGVVQSVVFDAIKFDPASAAKWCSDHGYEPVRTDWAQTAQPEATKPAEQAPPVEQPVEMAKEPVAAECDKPKVTAAQVTAMVFGRYRPVTAADVTAMVIQAREVSRITAADVTATILGKYDPRQPRDRGGRFGSGGGATLADSKANDLRDKAESAGDAAEKGSASHADAIGSYSEAGQHAGEVARRSLKELQSALSRRDATSATVHQAEHQKATTNVAHYQERTLYHSQKLRERSEEAAAQGSRDKSNVKKGFKRGFFTGGSMATAIGLALLALKQKITGDTGEPILDDKEKLAIATDAIFASRGNDAPDIHAAATGRLSHAPDIIAVVGGVSIKAADSPRQTPRFKIAPAYNGGELRVGKYDLPVIVDLAGLSINPQSVQAVLFHDETRLVGHVDRVTNTGKALSLEGSCSGLASVVAEFIESANKQFPWKASIEARPLERPELIPAGQVVTVNGQRFEGPVYVARKAELYGVSFVPRGADDQTIVSIAARAARNQEEGEQTMARIRAEISFEEWADAIGVTPQDLEANPELAKRMKDKYAEAMKGISEKPAEAAEDEEVEKPFSAEDDKEVPPEEEKEPVAARQRFDLDVIRATFDDKTEDLDVLYAKYEDSDDLKRADLRTIQATIKSDMRSLKAKAISGRWAGTRFNAECKAIHAKAELELVRKSRPRGPVISVSRGDVELTSDVLAAAVLQAGGYSLRRIDTGADGRDKTTVIEAAENVFPERTMELAHKKFRGSIGLQRLLIEAAQMNGWNGRYLSDGPQDCMRHAFTPIHAEGPSTADMSGLLSNVANKFLLQGFFFVEQAWRDISAIEKVNDFKTRSSYRLIGAETFQLVPPSGELKHGTLGEEAFTNKADTYGLMLNVTRTDVINDDLGAITTVPKKLGRGAGLAMNKVFWTKFLGQISTLFTGARFNYQSGASTVLGIDSLTAAEALFMNLKDGQGEPIGHMPTILLTGTSLSALGAQLFRDTNVVIAGVTDSKLPASNPHAGKFKPVVSRYVSNTGYTGGTATGWGIMADPADVPVMEMCFLYGQEAPTVEQADADFNTLGIQMRAFLDFGCNTQDYRGGVWSAGA